MIAIDLEKSACLKYCCTSSCCQFCSMYMIMLLLNLCQFNGVVCKAIVISQWRYFRKWSRMEQLNHLILSAKSVLNTKLMQQWFVAKNVQDVNKQCAVILGTCCGNVATISWHPTDHIFKQQVYIVKHTSAAPKLPYHQINESTRTALQSLFSSTTPGDNDIFLKDNYGSQLFFYVSSSKMLTTREKLLVLCISV